MPEEPPPPPLPRVVRPPVPGWMWAAFGLGPILLGMVIGASDAGPSDLSAEAAIGAGVGFLSALPMLGGLALAARFFSGTAARILGGLAFSVLVSVGVGAVILAGCMCIGGGSNFH